MVITPQSEVKLYRGIETRRLLAFSSAANRDAYFALHLYRSFNDFTTVRHSVSKVKLEISGQEANVCNYISFKNPAFDNKIFYARIVDYDYISNETTGITFAINDWYTWCFDVRAGEMHIDREHLSVAQYDRSLENPFDPSLVDFQTDEPLPVPREYEKKIYDVNSQCNPQTVIDDILMREDANNVLSVALDGRTTLSEDLIQSNYNVICFSDFNTIEATPQNYMRLVVDYISNSTEPGFFVYSGGRGVEANAELMSRYNLDSVTFQPDAFGMTKIGALPTRINRGFHIVATLDMELYDRIINEITANNATSQIIGVYSIPEVIFMAMINWAFNGSGNKIMGSGMNFDKFRIQAPKTYDLGTDMDPKPIKNTKLCMSPFSFLRVITPAGDQKDYAYEDFKTVYDEDSWIEMSGVKDTYVEFKFTGSFDATPTVSFVPLDYKFENIMYGSWNSDYVTLDTDTFTTADDYRANYFERIEFNRMPQMPYQTDAYLAFIASAASATMDSHTMLYDQQYQNQMIASYSGDIINGASTLISGGLSTIAGGLSHYMNADKISRKYTAGNMPYNQYLANNAANDLGYQQGLAGTGVSVGGMAGSLINNSFNRDLMRSQMEIMEGAEKLNLQDMESNPFVSNLKNARKTHGKSIYHPGTAGGMEYYNFLSPFDFIVMKVSLRPEIMKQYDKFFTQYGYNSMRLAKPRIFNFINGESDDKKLPMFLQIEENELIDKYVTYIKTIDAEFVAPLKSVEEYFATLFTAGVQFYDGDRILSQESGNNE